MFRNTTSKEIILRLTAYDPLVSDTACQTRAVSLTYLARKIKSGNGITDSEETYLNDCLFLTKTRKIEKNPFGVIIIEQTDVSQVPACFFKPFTSINPTQTAKNKIIAEKKKQVAETTIQFIKKLCNDMIYLDGLENSSAHITLYDNRIPILPCYISTKLMLSYAAKEKIPIVINLKRIKQIDDGIKMVEILEGNAMMIYQITDVGKFMLREKDTLDLEEVISIDMINYVTNQPYDTASQLHGDTFELFIESFKKQDLVTLIMACAAVHDQYPKSAKVSANDVIFSKSIIDIASTDSIKLNICSMNEYLYLKKFANKCGIPCKNIYIDHIAAEYMGKLNKNFDVYKKILRSTT